jgi:CHASE3 domain
MTRNPNSEPPKARAPTSAEFRFASLILVCLTIVALGAVAYFTERGIVRSRDWVIHTYRVRSQLNDLQLEIIRAHPNATNSLLEEGTPWLARAAEQADLARQTVNTLQTLTQDNPRQQQRLAQLGQILQDSRSLLDPRPNSGGTRMRRSPNERKRQEEMGDRERQISSIVSSMQRRRGISPRPAAAGLELSLQAKRDDARACFCRRNLDACL